MKKYKVSLAVKVPQNYEVEVEAKDEKDAQKKAIDMFQSEDCFNFGEVVECECGDICLDIGKAYADSEGIKDGVSIEEITEE
jgi:hypothetical protein